MRDKALLDISTINRAKQSAGPQGPGPIPALTVVSHPVLDRVGDRLLLEALPLGRQVAVSRTEPDFLRPGEAMGWPLSDPGLSRSKPLLLTPGSRPGAIRLEASEGSQVVVPGAASQGPWEFSTEQVASGVPLELAERVVLLLHLADPTAKEKVDALGMVGTSIGIHQVRRHIEQVADLGVPVLIRGETGSGKELIAQAIHRSSRRRDKAFITVNLGAITKELATAELFGAAKGAYTGAVKDREGFFQAAHGGTLFLDEVAEAPPEVQAMLLRVLETGEIHPVGERTPVKVDVRFIAATDAPLEQQSQEGRFKAPLMHRLGGYTIRVPPLRERREDIGLLFLHFARQQLEALGEGHRLHPVDVAGEPWLPASLASRLVRYGWPGNIRQLHNVTRQIVIGSRGLPSLRLDPALEQDLSGPAPTPVRPPAAEPPAPPARTPARRKISDYSEEEIVGTLEAKGWEIKKAADQLGVARTTLYDWLERNPQVRRASAMSEEELARHHRECQGDLEAMSQRLKMSRWALLRRLKELGLLEDAST